MAGAEAERESSRDASERRLEFAVEAITAAFRQKHGNQKAHGEFSVTLHWKAGEVHLVTVQDSTAYK